jgi:D-sedoheptulose 7-phosphate isomerase
MTTENVTTNAATQKEVPEGTSIIAAHFAESIRTVEASAKALGAAADAAGSALVKAVLGGRKILCFGNGGSASQASHMAGELIGRFKETRRPYAAIALGTGSGSPTCFHRITPAEQ